MNINLFKTIKNPIQYLNNEPNSFKKNWEKAKLKFLLAYPDLYEIGSSNLGIQILYYILNSHKEILCDRIYAPDLDFIEKIKKNEVYYFSVEHKRKPLEFDIIAFSFQYELNYSTALKMLELMEIPIFSEERTNKSNIPLICAGGCAVVNPLPLIDYFDFFAIGDGEELIIEKCNTLLENKNKNKNKYEILEKLSKIEGIYVPILKNKVRRRILKKFQAKYIPFNPIVPITKSVHKRLSIEISRGCTAGCRFCQAGIIYRPVREKDVDIILNQIEKGVKSTGFEEVSLLSLSIGDFSKLNNLISALSNCDLKISLPSIRANTLTENLLKFILKREKTGFTIAPEAGTERLRKVINKNLKDEEILTACEKLFKNGWNLIKLYFMIGLPTETEEDILGIVNLCNNILKIGEKYSKKNRINVTISPFVPKPHTPFQWIGQEKLENIYKKIEILKRNIKNKKISLKWHEPKMSFIEAILSRGDEKISKLLYEVYKNGAYLEAWSNYFNFSIWEKTSKLLSIDLKSHAEKNYKFNEKLPWDFVDVKIKKDFLINECKKAFNEIQTPDCRFTKCHSCGVCNNSVKNIFSQSSDKKLEIKRIFDNEEFIKVRFYFEKKGFSSLCGAISTMELILRAIVKSGIKVKYKKGFKPRIKISFSPPKKVGEETENEYFEIFVGKDEDLQNFLKKINSNLIEGMRVTGYEVL